jgi:exonuclease SbcD
VLGLLHGEVGALASRYAPLVLNDLWSAPVDFWLLGHIHARGAFESPDGRRALYPGSPWAMDPGERGSHGAYLANFEGATLKLLEWRPISPVLFAVGQVDVESIDSQSDLFESIMLALQGIGQVASEQHGTALQAVSCRLQLAGRTTRLQEIGQWARHAEKNIEPIPIDGNVVVHLDKLTLEARPAIDLFELSKGMDPAGELARLIISLDSPNPHSPVVDQLLRSANTSANIVWQHSAYAQLLGGGDELVGPDSLTLVQEQAWQLLSTLIVQRERP